MDEEIGNYNVCVDATNVDNRTIQTLPATVVSSSLSIIGSLLIIVTFVIWSDIRKSTARKILLFLAVADLFTAATYLSAAVSHYVFVDKEKHNKISDSNIFRNNSQYKDFCEGQAFVTVYFQVASFMWTSFLAIYFLVVLVFQKPNLGSKMILPFQFFAWGIPMIICIVVESLKMFGLGDSRSSVGWCFIKNEFVRHTSSVSDHTKEVYLYFILEIVTIKLWEVLTYFIIIGCYIIIFISNRCKLQKETKSRDSKQKNLNKDEDDLYDTDISHSGQWSSNYVALKSDQPESSPIRRKRELVEAISKTDLKLLLVPVTFLLIRIWGTIRFFISMWPHCHIFNPTTTTFFCIDKHCFDMLYNKELLTLHALGDPAQGFANVILFVFLSKAIFIRLFGPIIKIFKMFVCCCCTSGSKSDQHDFEEKVPEKLKVDKTKSKIIIIHHKKPVKQVSPSSETRMKLRTSLASDDGDTNNYGTINNLSGSVSI